MHMSDWSSDVCSSDLIEALVCVKDSFNSYPLDRLAQAGAIASFQDEAYFQFCREKIIHGRDVLTRGLETLDFEVLPSSANFVFARHRRHDGSTLAARLREEAVLVRHFNAPRISDYLRITVGTEEEIGVLRRARKSVVWGKRVSVRGDRGGRCFNK